MSDADEGIDLAPAGSREYGVVALAIACAAAVILVAALVPVVASGGIGDSPAGSLVPILGAGDDASADAVDGAGGNALAGGGLGTLNPGQAQSVGGTIREDDGANPFRSQDTEVHFTVRSTSPDYWRTGAYDTYTGAGWERSGPSDTTVSVTDEEVSYRVELAAAARSAPTVWRPDSLDGPDGLTLGADGLAGGSEPLPAGTEYEGTSRTPLRDPSVLAASGRAYPDSIEERYTALPAETRTRLGPFTRNLTAGADSPYETAVRIEEWLEANKNYSLEVDEPPDEDVATQFVFEMDRGYCEYYATSMVAMLRSEGIPARYAVGYSTGQQVDDHTYRVRAMNAHAWVEVYFADVGWVRFDPTPGGDRLQRERQSFQEADEPGSYNASEEGSPGEAFSPNRSAAPSTPGGQSGSEPSTEAPSDGSGASTPDATPRDPTAPTTPDGQPADTTPTPTPTPPEPPEPGDSEDDPETTVELNRTAVPGAAVEVSVTRDGASVVGATVLFNGDSIGQTDEAGTVTGTVPYASTLDVSVEGGETQDLLLEEVAAERTERDAIGTAPSRIGGVPAPGSDSRRFSLSAPGSASLVESMGVGDEGRASAVQRASDSTSARNGTTSNATASFDVQTTANLSVSGTARTNAEVVVTATIDGHPVRDAAVTVDGRRVARTDDIGRATVRLPSEPGNATLGVERGPIAGERTLELHALTAAVDPGPPVPVAGLPVEVTARLGDRPVAGAPIRVGGETVGETDVDGTYSVAMPAESSVPIAVSSAGQTARIDVSNPLVNAAALVGALVGLLAAGGVALSRRPADPTSAIAWLERAIALAYRGLVGLLVRGALGVERLATLLARRARLTVASIAAVIAGRRSPSEAATALRGWLRNALDRLRVRVPAVADRTDDATPGDGAPGDAADEARVTIREAWSRFLDRVSARGTRTMTPDQIARHAVAVDGLPPEAVRTLRDQFRAVEFGPRAPDDAVPAVAAALRRIEARDVDGSGDRSPDGASDDGAGARDGADGIDGAAERRAESVEEPPGGDPGRPTEPTGGGDD